MLAATNFAEIESVPVTVQRGVAVFVAPLLILAIAHYFGPVLTRHLPSSLAGLEVWGPAMGLLLTALLALTFNRGRVLFATLALATSYLAYHLTFKHGLTGSSMRAVFEATCLLVPLNLIVLSLTEERGIFSFYGVRRIGLLALEAGAVVWLYFADGYDLSWLHRPLLGDAAAQSAVPQLAMLLMLGGSLMMAVRAVVRRCALDAGMAGALSAFAIAAHTALTPPHFAVYISAGAAILAVAVLQDTFRLAFRDELTGLPSRRALNERLMSLGHAYTIAMVDVDHFKHFNDTHGHALGDHVLRMVASKLDQVGGGGRAYRYGGEEFAVLFPGKRVRDVWPHLEALRTEIAGRGVVARHPVRDKELRNRPGHQGRRVSVTVSIGVAERDDHLYTPDAVLRTADLALYRAKDKGRNCVSR